MGKRADGLTKLDRPVAGPADGPAPESVTGDDGGPPDPPHNPDDPDLSFWQKVPGFVATWEAHVKRWPDGPAKPGTDHRRPDDPPGCWRGDGGRYLSPQDNAEADQQIKTLRQPERAATAILLAIQQDNSHGGHLAGLDYRFKGSTRLKEKIADKMGVKADTTPADAAGAISDAVRYTFSFSTDEYVGGFLEVKERLESAGYKMTYGENHWLNDPQYKGVNTRWQAPSGGRFEVQFHTSESFYAKEHLTHPSYERLRTPTISRAEQRALKIFQKAVCGAIPEPSGIMRISNYDGRT